MIVVMKSGTPSAEIERVSQEIRSWDITPEKLEGTHKVVIGLESWHWYIRVCPNNGNGCNCSWCRFPDD